MAKFRIIRGFEAAGSQVFAEPGTPRHLRVQIYVDAPEREQFFAYDFSMRRSDMENLRDQIDVALRATTPPARKRKT